MPPVCFDPDTASRLSVRSRSTGSCAVHAALLVRQAIGAYASSKPSPERARSPNPGSASGVLRSPGGRDAIALLLILKAFLDGNYEHGVEPQHAARSPWDTRCRRKQESFLKSKCGQENDITTPLLPVAEEPIARMAFCVCRPLKVGRTQFAWPPSAVSPKPNSRKPQ